ncbi:hypothetical protein RI103_25715 [Paraburkholderia sp. FT54]|uniref:hypothetical protein n=1 Tax=Paraburkholderia sp. FT54 TaxID=3074437 RepID=UPI0028777D1E|nr:hypothetical protein [Paraburkholderia sp. FT54]WNC94163.1 hypothetical protein RI103_25715 [Paraburkholderia sp. FT54]
MKSTIAAVITASFVLLPLSGVSAQESSGAKPSATSEHPDEIVRMHQQVAAANREYRREVASAQKVFDHKKAEAKKKRDVAVEAAQHGTSQ